MSIAYFPIKKVLLFITSFPSSSCWIGDSETLQLSELLKINSSISQLYLKSVMLFRIKLVLLQILFYFLVNMIGPSGALSLSEALKINSSLTELDLVNTNGRKSVEVDEWFWAIP